MSAPTESVFHVFEKMSKAGFLATYWVTGAIGQPQDPILTSRSHHWVCPEHAGPRRLFSCWCSQMNFLTTPLSGKLVSAQFLPPPHLENDPHPFHQKLLVSTRVFMFYRVGVINWAVPTKKSQTMGTFYSFFLSLVWKTQANHWTKRMVSTRLTT